MIRSVIGRVRCAFRGASPDCCVVTDMADLPRPDFLELPVADVAAAQAFYGATFGWTMTGFGPTYACTLTGDVDVGLQADPAEQTRAPLIVIQVADLEEAQAL